MTVYMVTDDVGYYGIPYGSIKVSGWITRSSTVEDIIEVIRSQLPRTIERDPDIQIEVASDPYHLRTILKVKAGGREYETQLEDMQVGARKLSCKIPELFLARLCAECP